MSFFEYINHIKEYLHSIRNVVENKSHLFAIDLKLPAKWEIDKHLTTPQEKASVKLQKDGEQFKIYTFFTPFDESGVNEIYERVIYIIDKNVEDEKKRILLNKKLMELKSVFDVKINELKSKFNELPLDELEHIDVNVINDEKQEFTSP